MPEIQSEKTIFTLAEVGKSIQKTIATRYTSAYWIKAEMNKLNFYKHSGHCYPDLVEKVDGKIIAQIRAYLWKDDFRRINAKFQSILKENLKDGIKILFQAKISFDALHGIALWIVDIDPHFTLGDLEREKQETINHLKQENIFYANKNLPFPLLPKRLAIISVETSKGFADFAKIITTNPWRYKIFYFLFPALLQGDSAAASILVQLKRIERIKHHFDAVLLIRGGGGEVGLTCYNNFSLSKAICEFPLPVLTGIGHATNETVVEMVAYANAITPSKLAELLIQKFHNFSVPVQEAERKLKDNSMHILRENKNNFTATIKLFRSVTQRNLEHSQQEITHLSKSLSQGVRFNFKTYSSQLYPYTIQLQKAIQHLFMQKNAAIIGVEKNIELLNPISILKRGFSITLFKNKALTSAATLQKEDVVETILWKGRIKSKIIDYTKNKTDD